MSTKTVPFALELNLQWGRGLGAAEWGAAIRVGPASVVEDLQWGRGLGAAE